ncbi:MAG: ROK family protein [Eubacteriales bacterium]|nr:ROK family protein [Eubacteriales bacterium]
MRLGIDLGGTSVKAALCEEHGKVLAKKSIPTRADDAETLCADMKQIALSLCRGMGVSLAQITGIGIGAPGSVDKASCTLKFGPNLGLRDVCFAEAFLPEFHCAVRIENDANCAALGEATVGAARDAKNMLMVTLGTGVGGGIIIDGKLYTGSNGIAGEMGHLVIREDGEPCGCGRKGCLEAYASATAFVKFAERALAAGRESSLQAQAGHLDAKQICDAVDAGDPLACELFEQYCKDLSCGLASYINIFQPECIVLGGGLAGYGEKLLEPLRRLTLSQTFRADANDTELVCASLGNDAGMIGAAML